MTRRAFLSAGAATVAIAPGGAAAAGYALQGLPVAEHAGDSRVPYVEVVTHTGLRARFRSDLVRDRVVLLNVFFTSCGDTCPLVMQNLVGVHELLRDRIARGEVLMCSISLQPELETPEILRDYAALHGIGPGWELLTGAPADLALLRDRLGFTGPSPELDLLDDRHTGMLRYGSDALDRWSACPALLPPATIAKAIRGSMPVA